MSAAMELHVALSMRLDAIEAYRLAHAYRDEVLTEAKREVIAWLVKKAREGTPIEQLASKVDRGAVRIFLGSEPYAEPLIVDRFDTAMEPALEEELVFIVGAIAENGRPVALCFDPEDRRKVGRWLAPDEEKATATPAATATSQGPVFDPLPSYLHAIGQAGSRCEQELYAAYVQAITEVTRLQAETGDGQPSAGEAAAGLTVYRTSHDSIVMGLYTTAAAAREHCEAEERRSWAKFEGPTFDWIEDEEDGVAELTAWVGGEECTTGYEVTALEVASTYDEEADE